MCRGVRDHGRPASVCSLAVEETVNTDMQKMLASLRKLRRSLLAGQWIALRCFGSSNATCSNYRFECCMIACCPEQLRLTFAGFNQSLHSCFYSWLSTVGSGQIKAAKAEPQQRKSGTRRRNSWSTELADYPDSLHFSTGFLT